MRRTLAAVAVGLLTLAGSAWADSPIVRWNRIEGVIGADLTEIRVGPIYASTRWRTAGAGSAMVNLKTGFLSFRLTGASAAKNFLNQPLGAPSPSAGGSQIGTVVCNATERFGPVEWVNTPVLTTEAGGVSFQGFVVVPESCRAHPEDIVFLIRHPENSPQMGAFNFYGADRTIAAK